MASPSSSFNSSSSLNPSSSSNLEAEFVDIDSVDPSSKGFGLAAELASLRAQVKADSASREQEIAKAVAKALSEHATVASSSSLKAQGDSSRRTSYNPDGTYAFYSAVESVDQADYCPIQLLAAPVMTHKLFTSTEQAFIPPVDGGSLAGLYFLLRENPYAMELWMCTPYGGNSEVSKCYSSMVGSDNTSESNRIRNVATALRIPLQATRVIKTGTELILSLTRYARFLLNENINVEGGLACLNMVDSLAYLLYKADVPHDKLLHFFKENWDKARQSRWSSDVTDFVPDWSMESENWKEKIISRMAHVYPRGLKVHSDRGYPPPAKRAKPFSTSAASGSVKVERSLPQRRAESVKCCYNFNTTDCLRVECIFTHSCEYCANQLSLSMKETGHAFKDCSRKPIGTPALTPPVKRK